MITRLLFEDEGVAVGDVLVEAGLVVDVVPELHPARPAVTAIAMTATYRLVSRRRRGAKRKSSPAATIVEPAP